MGFNDFEPTTKIFDFPRKVLFNFPSEAQALNFIDQAKGKELPFLCPISHKKVHLRLKIHVPAEERTHARTLGVLRRILAERLADLDWGSNGAKGDIFFRDGEKGTKVFKVLEEQVEGPHKIEPLMEPLADIGFDVTAVRGLIATARAELVQK